MFHKRQWLAAAFVLAPLCAFAAQGGATSPTPSEPARNSQVNTQGDNALGCKLTYTISGWSIIYHAANGHGTVTCSNGKSMDVNLAARGAGLTVGKYRIDDGHGTFKGVLKISDVLGTYGMATAHAGVGESSHAIALTKGVVTLALTGSGSGWNIGAGLAGFTISRANGKAS